MSIKFIKTYSRERPLFCFCMWRDMFIEANFNFLGYKIKQDLFIIPKNAKGQVWHSQKDVENIGRLFEKNVKNKKEFQKLSVKVFSRIRIYWPKLHKYLLKNRKIKNIAEFLMYYHDLVMWWSAVEIVYSIPNAAGIDEKEKEKFLAFRAKFEKYSEEFYDPMIDFVADNYPEYKKFVRILTPFEVKKIAEGKILPKEKREIQKRKDGYTMIDGKIYSLSALKKTLKEENIVLENFKIKKIKSVKGLAAFHGFIRGKARIVLTNADLKKILLDEILITNMTSPDFVPFLSQVRAIITDEGSITCHAAIIARELKKPTIIGTKIATKVFKNGDNIEVDTKKGIAKIVSS